jgi:hypothetical protein
VKLDVTVKEASKITLAIPLRYDLSDSHIGSIVAAASEEIIVPVDALTQKYPCPYRYDIRDKGKWIGRADRGDSSVGVTWAPALQ